MNCHFWIHYPMKRMQTKYTLHCVLRGLFDKAAGHWSVVTVILVVILAGMWLWLVCDGSRVCLKGARNFTFAGSVPSIGYSFGGYPPCNNIKNKKITHVNAEENFLSFFLMFLFRIVHTDACLNNVHIFLTWSASVHVTAMLCATVFFFDRTC